MRLLIFLLFILSLGSCKEQGKNREDGKNKTGVKDTTAPKDYFPVTDFILGEMQNIRDKGINPIKVSEGDSSWVKIEDLDKEMAEFLTPAIGKDNMIPLFEETSFMDQTTNSYTFTYDARGPLPDTMPLKHWDVYVEPVKNKVWRVYILKELPGSRIQLTWESGKRCTIVKFSKDQNGELGKPSEILFFWNY